MPFVDVTAADWRICVACGSGPDEWHLDLEKNVTMDNLGSYPACPHSSKKRDLRAIRGPDRRAKGVRSQCRRSLTLFEDSLHSVEEIESVPGALAVPLLVRPTAALDSAAEAVTIGGNTLTATVPSDLRSSETQKVEPACEGRVIQGPRVIESRATDD